MVTDTLYTSMYTLPVISQREKLFASPFSAMVAMLSASDCALKDQRLFCIRIVTAHHSTIVHRISHSARCLHHHELYCLTGQHRHVMCDQLRLSGIRVRAKYTTAQRECRELAPRPSLQSPMFFSIHPVLPLIDNRPTDSHHVLASPLVPGGPVVSASAVPVELSMLFTSRAARVKL